jgi:hypothetical protein
MIDYGSFAPPPRRRRGGGVMLAVGAVVVLVLGGLGILVMGHVLARGGTADAASRSGMPGRARTAAAPAIRQAGELSLGACIDPTRSIVPSFALAIRADLARAVAGLAPPPGTLPTNTLNGTAVAQPQAGVNLTVRQVFTNSFTNAQGPYTQTAAVPPISGLASRPAPGSPDYLTRLQDWTADYGVVTAARRAAASAAAAGAFAIAGMPLDRNGWSGISACISGLLTTVPPGGTHSYLLASDLQENVAPQLAGSFHGAPLVIIQTCDTGNVTHCRQLLTHFIGLMQRLDVGRITVVRPELAAADIDQWIRTGEVTP